MACSTGDVLRINCSKVFLEAVYHVQTRSIDLDHFASMEFTCVSLFSAIHAIDVDQHSLFFIGGADGMLRAWEQDVSDHSIEVQHTAS